MHLSPQEFPNLDVATGCSGSGGDLFLFREIEQELQTDGIWGGRRFKLGALCNCLLFATPAEATWRLRGLGAWRLRGQGILKRQEAKLRREIPLFLFRAYFVSNFQLEASTTMHTHILNISKFSHACIAVKLMTPIQVEVASCSVISWFSLFPKQH